MGNMKKNKPTVELFFQAEFNILVDKLFSNLCPEPG